MAGFTRDHWFETLLILWLGYFLFFWFFQQFSTYLFLIIITNLYHSVFCICFIMESSSKLNFLCWNLHLNINIFQKACGSCQNSFGAVNAVLCPCWSFQYMFCSEKHTSQWFVHFWFLFSTIALLEYSYHFLPSGIKLLYLLFVNEQYFSSTT